MKYLSYILVMAALMIGACNKSLTPQQAATVQKSITSQQYIFKAETANPFTGKSIHLTPGYDLQVNDKMVVATLPYYGRAYTAPIDPNQIGVKFTSKKFTYTATPNDKGDWDIVIIPEDVPDIQQLRLSITPEGYATLYVTSTSRQAISYYGYIAKNKVATTD